MLYFKKNLLVFLFTIPLIGMAVLLLIPKNYHLLLKCITLLITTVNFWIGIFLWCVYELYTHKFMGVVTSQWVPVLIFKFIIGVDGTSSYFLMLTLSLFPICVLKDWNLFNVKYYFIALLCLEFFLIGAFCCSFEIIE
jgi:NADH:ubiquinone oxidoreductase subunit 4 (subunit M)